jgi:hypothetical protein
VVTIIPISVNVLEAVEKMAENDGMPEGLKLQTKSGIILYDSAWIAGVDYAQNDDNEENNNVIDDNNELFDQ